MGSIIEYQKLQSKFDEAEDAYEDEIGRTRPSTFMLEEIVGSGHPVFKAYPLLRVLPIKVGNTGVNVLGSATKNGIIISPASFGRQTLAHEVQHVIQEIEGFAKGGNLNTVSEDTLQEEYAKAGKALDEAAAKNGTNRFEAIDEDFRTDNTELQKAIDDFKKAQRHLMDGQPGAYKRLAGEVESRNVQARMDMPPEERRQSLASETEDVSREDQIFLFGENGVSAMGSRTDKKMEQVGRELEGRELSAEQQVVADVFSGKADNLPLTVERTNGKKTIYLRMGNDAHGGAKHSLFAHYGTTKGVIAVDDILRIPEVVAKGERKPRGDNSYQYKYHDTETKTTYTIVTNHRNGREEFADFYTNKKAHSIVALTQMENNSDTPEGAHNIESASSAANVGNNSETSSVSGENVSGGKLSLREKALDKEYMDAVERGDMETAQRMVDEKTNEQLNEILLPNDKDEQGFKYHRGEAPKKTFRRYAVMNVTPEGFKAAYAGNRSGTPLGVWLDAQNLKSYMSDIVQFQDGTFSSYIQGNTGKNWKEAFSEERMAEMQEGGLATKDKWLLERGGKHSSDVPNFSQMNIAQNEKGEKVSSKGKDGALPHNKLIFEIEYGISDDGDLTDYVKEHGRIDATGKNQGLAKIGPTSTTTSRQIRMPLAIGESVERFASRGLFLTTR